MPKPLLSSAILLPLALLGIAAPTEALQGPTLPANATADWGSSPPERQAWTRAAFAAVSEAGGRLWQSGFGPADISAYCPAYSTQSETNRKLFWVGLISALARFESNFRPETTYVEEFSDPDGPVVSRGLLQISRFSANQRAYGCAIGDQQELHDPAINLRCGVKILNYQVPRGGRIAGMVDGRWKGASAYWSPFRKEQRRRAIAAWTSRQNYCRAT
jgi:hypothetical protein